jgi:hypothetical protein
MHRRTLSKQSLQVQVSAKLTPEICINNTSSNSRLTAVGRQVTAADTIHRTVSRLFFFLFFSLPLMREQLKYTCMLKNLLKLYGIRTWDTWWVFLYVFCFCFCFVQFCSTLCVPFDETTTEQYLRHHLQDWRLRQTPKLLRLKLHCISTSRVFFNLFFITYFSFCFILFL